MVYACEDCRVRCVCEELPGACAVVVQSWRGGAGRGWGASHRLLEEVDDLRHVAAQLEGELLHAARRTHVTCHVRSAALARVGLAECRSSGELPYY